DPDVDRADAERGEPGLRRLRARLGSARRARLRADGDRAGGLRGRGRARDRDRAVPQPRERQRRRREPVAMVESAAAASDLLRWIPLLPLLGAAVHGVLLGLVRRELPRSLVIALSVGAPALAFVVTLLAFFQLRGLPAGSALVDEVYTWIGAGRVV